MQSIAGFQPSPGQDANVHLGRGCPRLTACYFGRPQAEFCQAFSLYFIESIKIVKKISSAIERKLGHSNP